MNETTYKKSTLSLALLAILLGGCKGGSGGSLGGDSGGDSGTTQPPEPNPNPSGIEINIAQSATFNEPTTGSRTEFITVTLSKIMDSDITLTLSAVPISADASTGFKNYELAQQSFVIKAGDTTAQLPLKVINNNLYENDVTLNYIISAEANSQYKIVNNSAVITIQDSNGIPAIGFSSIEDTLNEGQTNSYKLALSHYSALETSATLVPSGSATLSDYRTDLASGNKIVIAARTLTGSVVVDAIDDEESEQDEILTLTLSAPSDSTIDPSANSLKVTIPGDIPTPGPDASQISINTSETFNEPTTGKNTEHISVRLSKPLSADLILTLNTQAISARDSGQFQNFEPLIAHTVTIAAGDTLAQLPLIVTNNNLYENDVTLKYTISAPLSTEYVISNNEASVSLKDSDGVPKVRFEKMNRTLLEGEQESFFVELSHYSHTDSSITLEQSGDVEPDDFLSDLGNDGKLTISSQTLSTSFSVTAKDDGLSEGAESLIYTLTQPEDIEIDTDNSILGIYIPGDKRFNDTGYITKFNGTVFDETGLTPDYPNQDADFGLDNETPPNHNDGQYGFSYSKFDSDGNSLPIDATEYSCIRDNATGLYIERKPSLSDIAVTLPSQTTLDAELDKQRDDPDNYVYPYSTESAAWQHTSYKYTWYEPDDESNGGYQGAKEDDMRKEVPVDIFCAVSENSGSDRRCDSNGYLSQMNQFGVCGITDWRLPSPSEARSFVNYNVNNDEDADNYFLTFIEGQTILTNATRPDKQGSAWCVNTETGQAKLCLKNKHYPIVAVSGGNQ